MPPVFEPKIDNFFTPRTRQPSVIDRGGIGTSVPDPPNPAKRFQFDEPIFDPTGLQSILEEVLGAARTGLEAGQRAGADVGRFLRPTDFGRVRRELGAVAEGISGDLFDTGGPVDQAIRQASGASVESGFGPSSGGRDQAIFNILRGARGEINRGIAQAAPQLASVAVRDRLGNLQAAAGRESALLGLGLQGLESGFTGAANIQQGILADAFGRANLGLSSELGFRQADLAERGLKGQLGLARRQLDQNQQLINEYINRGGCGIGDRLLGGVLGAGSGAKAGSRFPGPGTLIGGGLGFLGGLFGGGC